VSTVERRLSNSVAPNLDLLTRADVLTATEASALLGIPRSTLYDLARGKNCRPAGSDGAGSFAARCSNGQLSPVPSPVRGAQPSA